MPRRLLLPVGTLALACALMLPSAAPAAVTSAGGFKYASKVHQVPVTGTPRTLRSACPAKTQVIGGGHYNTGLHQQADVGHSFPYDSADKRKVPDDGWAVQLMTPSTALDVFTYAICAKVKPTYRQVSLDVDPTGTVTGNVYCGIDGNLGLPIISGGTGGHEYARARVSYPVDDVGGYDSWAFTADNASGAPRPVKAFAICADLDVSYHSVIGAMPAMQQQATSASCPPGRHIVGGGVSSDADDQQNMIVGSRPQAFSDFTDDAWRITLDEYLNDSFAYQVWAVCAAPLN